MREIKFRIWHKKINAYLHETSYDPAITIKTHSDFTYEPVAANLAGIDNDAVFEQYTGLHDWHGEEIYEGDVLGHREKSAKLYVFYEKGSFVITPVDGDQPFFGDTPLHNINTKHFEKIGNIHEEVYKQT